MFQHKSIMAIQTDSKIISLDSKKGFDKNPVSLHDKSTKESGHKGDISQ